MSKNRFLTNQKGFTIVELLIATSVFASILLVLMVGVIYITQTYYKGLTQYKTQDTARNILNDLSQAIQFNGSIELPSSTSSTVNSQRICIGSQTYSYLLGYELGTTTRHTLVLSPNCSAKAQNLQSGPVTGKELLSQNMRLANLSIVEIGATNSYTIDVRVVYGSSDLLSNPKATNAACKVKSGDQFCAVAELTTIVQKRVNGT